MSEDLTKYLEEIGIKVRYMHSEVKTLERMEIIRDLRLGEFDVLVGINLLREGLDLPEVSLVAILDADKEGFLRSETALVQTIGRAARNTEGLVIMYADKMTPSMERAIGETNRRREIQDEYNKANDITPMTIRKSVRSVIEATKVAEDEGDYNVRKLAYKSADEIYELVIKLEEEMHVAAENFRFERAAELRDKVAELRKRI